MQTGSVVPHCLNVHHSGGVFAYVPQCVIAVDPSSEASMAYFERVIDCIPDRVPCMAVACSHASAADGVSRLMGRCEELSVSVSVGLPACMRLDMPVYFG